MTFSIDSCIIIGIANKEDCQNDRSKKLLLKRKDKLVILLTVILEAVSTYDKKFNRASVIILSILEKTKEFEKFNKEFESLMEKEREKERKKEKNIVNFLRLAYGMIEPHLRNENFKKVNQILLDHPIDTSPRIWGMVESLKEIKEVIFPEEKLRATKNSIEPIISNINFRKSKDRQHFLFLCAYSLDTSNDLDYITTDGRYVLNMLECMYLMKKNKKFKNIRVNPILLTDNYIASLN